MVVGVVLSMIGFVALNTFMSCPSGCCMYNPALAIAASAFPSGLTVIIARIVVMWMVKIESNKENRESS